MAVALFRYTALFVVGVAAYIVVLAQEPNFVKATTIEELNGVEKKVTSIVYSDGLGREIQSKKVLNLTTYNKITWVDGGNTITVDPREIVTSTEYDAAGRPFKTILPTPRNLNATYQQEIESFAIRYYDGTSGRGGKSFGVPYSETEYYDDPLGRVKKQASPNKFYSFHLEKAVSDLIGTHYSEFFYGSTSSDADAKFRSMTQLEEIRTNVNNTKMPADVNSKFFLSAVKHPNDKQYTQQMSDVFGNVVAKWASPSGVGTDPIISRYKYDIAGNLLEETPPKANGTVTLSSSYYTYNTLGQLLSKKTPDKKGSEFYEYDETGNLKHYTHGSKEIWYKYDLLGRSVCIYTGAATSNVSVKLRTIYDDPTNAEKFFQNPEIITLLTSLKNTVGRVVATIAYGEDCAQVATYDDPAACDNSVVELFSYDSEGRVEVRFLFIPGLQYQRFEYTYTPYQGLLSKVKQYFHLEQGTFESVTTDYVYNDELQLESLKRDTKKVVSYLYRPDGSLLRKQFYDGSQNSVAMVEYENSARGWAQKINAKLTGGQELFRQELTYEGDNGSGLFGGTVHKATYNYAGIARNYTYGYDKTDRLLSVRDGSGLESLITSKWDADYGYDNVGRLLYKREGIDQNTNGTYHYESITDNGTTVLTSRLDRVDLTSKSANDNFVYDDAGNMIADRSKKMVMKYDWRNLPVKFMFFLSLPAEISTINMDDMVSYVEMMYDAGGNRVLKQTYTK